MFDTEKKKGQNPFLKRNLAVTADLRHQIVMKEDMGVCVCVHVLGARGGEEWDPLESHIEMLVCSSIM